MVVRRLELIVGSHLCPFVASHDAAEHRCFDIFLHALELSVAIGSRYLLLRNP